MAIGKKLKDAASNLMYIAAVIACVANENKELPFVSCLNATFGKDSRETSCQAET